jgi:hypothetical protein
LKLSPENREEIITTRRNKLIARFGGNPRPNAPLGRVNVHDTHEVVNVDNIIYYTAISHFATETIGMGRNHHIHQLHSLLRYQELQAYISQINVTVVVRVGISKLMRHPQFRLH